MILAVGGPPNSGKSVFIASLHKALNDIEPSFSFLQRACPDGEGMWFLECSPELQERLRQRGSFTEYFINFIVESVKNLSKVFPLVLLDLGGRVSEENKTLLKECDALLVVTSSRGRINEWEEAAKKAGCRIAGIITSSLGSGESKIKIEDDGLIAGALFGLERGKGREKYWDAVVGLGKFLYENLRKGLNEGGSGRSENMEGAQKPVYYLLEKENHRLLYFEIPGKEGVTSPPLFAESVKGLNLASGKGLVVSGKGPIWGYGMILHKAHATPWVAFADPRLGGAVVVQSHNAEYSPGDIYPFPWAEIEEAKKQGPLGK